MTDLTALEALCRAATQGPWESDRLRSEGSYGTGDDIHEGFDAFQVFGPNGKSICDTLNSDVGEVHVEYDEDGASAWDEIARRNMSYIAAAHPAAMLALIDRVRRCEEALRPFAKMAADPYVVDMDDADCLQYMVAYAGDADCTVGDIRRAAAALPAAPRAAEKKE